MIRALIVLLLLMNWSEARPRMLFYCGTTMVPAVLEAKETFEQTHHCTIRVIQGGSKDLCKSIETTQKGDLFLPGKESYIHQCGQEGYVDHRRFVGYNRLALFVPKGNPKQVKNLDDLLRHDLITTLGNPATCSIGKATEETLMRYGGGSFLEKARLNLGLYAADSRDMNHLITSQQADIGLNWQAALYSQAGKGLIAIPISDLYALPQKLIIASLAYSRHKKLAKAFVDYLASEQGQAVMKRYGFFHE